MTIVPWKLRYLFSCLGNVRDLTSVAQFVIRRDLPIPFIARLRFVLQIYLISFRIDCAHTQEEILAVATALLKMPREVEGVIIEAGCFKGGSTAKFSLLARLANRQLIAFDSFEGLPDNDEANQKSMFGEVPNFDQGKYLGSLLEVRQNVDRYGDLERCTFLKGWFDETMPGFSEKIVAGYIDVDLASSTKTCLKYLFPLLQRGGSLFSQDGHLPFVQEVLADDAFWEREVGRKKPSMEGLFKQKLVRVIG